MPNTLANANPEVYYNVSHLYGNRGNYKIMKTKTLDALLKKYRANLDGDLFRPYVLLHRVEVKGPMEKIRKILPKEYWL